MTVVKNLKIKSTMYTFLVPMSRKDGLDLVRKLLDNVGYVKSIDLDTGLIRGRHRLSKFGGRLNTQKLDFRILPFENGACRVIAMLGKAGYPRGMDKHWDKILHALFEISHNDTFGLEFSNGNAKRVGVILDTEGYTVSVFNNGRLLVENKRTTSFSEDMPGLEYEHYVAKQLQAKGFKKVEVTKASGDFGADILAVDSDNSLVCIQCKKYAKPVGIQAVQEVLGAKAYYKGARAIVITNASFTPAAKDLAKRSEVELYANRFPVPKDELSWIDRFEEFSAFFED